MIFFKSILKPLVRTNFVLTLCLSLLAQTAYIPLAVAGPGESVEAPSEEYLESLRTLGKKFASPESSSHPLDSFHLLEQTLHNYQQEEIDETVARINEVEADGEEIDDLVDRSIKKKHYYRNNLKISLVDAVEKETPIRSFKEKDFLESKLDGKDHLFENFNSYSQDHIFHLTDKNGRPLHSFARPVQQVGFFGPYLIYVEEDHLNIDKGIAEVKFIDLEYFRGDIGNAQLPVFTLPLNRTSPIKDLQIKNGVLYIDDLPLEKKAFDFLSSTNRVIFNMAVTMADPGTLQRSENLVKEMINYFSLSLKETDKKIKDQLEAALDQEKDLQTIFKEAQARMGNALETQRELQGSAAGTSGLSEDIDDNVKAGKEVIEANNKINNALKASNAQVQYSRQFMARTHMFLTRFTSPRPAGAIVLIKSMAMLAGSLVRYDKVGARANWRDIKSHSLFKFLKYGSFTLAAGAIGPHLPEPYSFHLHQSLDFAQMLMEQVDIYLQKSNYGMAYVDLIGESFSKAASGIPNIPNAYFTPEKLPKFITGLTSVLTIPFIVFGIPHILVNSFKAYKSVKGKMTDITKKGQGRLKAFAKGIKEVVKGERNIIKSFNKKVLLNYLQKKAFSVNKENFIKFFQNKRETLRNLRKAFVEHVNDERTDYDKWMSDGEKEVSGEVSDLTDEEVKDLRDHINRNGGAVSEKVPVTKRFFKLIGKVLMLPFSTIGWTRNKIANVFDLAAQRLTKETQEMSRTAKVLDRLGRFIAVSAPTKSIDSFGKAMKNFFFSYPALTNTYRFLANTWNYFFLARSFAFYPKTWVMGIVYPRYFRVTIGDPRNFPSAYNGGTRTTAKHWSMRFKERGGDVELLKLREFEKAILPIEQIVYEEALQKSLHELMGRTENPELLKLFFDSTSNYAPGTSSTGLNNLADPKLDKLPPEELSFFRAYFTRTFDKSMRQYLEKFAQDRLSRMAEKINIEVDRLTTEELKSLSAHWIEDLEKYETELKEDNSEIKKVLHTEIRQTIKEVTADGNVSHWANDVATKFSFFFQRKNINYRHKLFKKIRAGNPQIKRFLTAEDALKNAKSLARAVRSEVASLIINKPVQLLGLLALYAGIEQGVLKPLHDVMNGPDSIIYMSRYLFYNGFVVGTVIGIMADTWMKVQTDARIQETGSFDKIPMKRYREKGFWRYYFKSTFSNPENKWWSNQLHYTKLIWANIPAAFITISIANFATLGRFDLGAFMAGYMVTFFTPLMGINLKFEQGFELASSWVASKIPRKYRAHPEAQRWINGQIQKKKFQFNIFYQTWEVFAGAMMGIFELIGTDKYGPRSFLRTVFGGYTPTELAALGLRKVGDVLGFIPGVEFITTKCEGLLTNNYTDWSKVKPR
jgi:hypothetical protein